MQLPPERRPTRYNPARLGSHHVTAWNAKALSCLESQVTPRAVVRLLANDVPVVTDSRMVSEGGLDARQLKPERGNALICFVRLGCNLECARIARNRRSDRRLDSVPSTHPKMDDGHIERILDRTRRAGELRLEPSGQPI
jgi:precorrin isomerase